MVYMINFYMLLRNNSCKQACSFECFLSGIATISLNPFKCTAGACFNHLNHRAQHVVVTDNLYNVHKGQPVRYKLPFMNIINVWLNGLRSSCR